MAQDFLLDTPASTDVFLLETGDDLLLEADTLNISKPLSGAGGGPRALAGAGPLRIPHLTFILSLGLVGDKFRTSHNNHLRNLNRQITSDSKKFQTHQVPSFAELYSSPQEVEDLLVLSDADLLTELQAVIAASGFTEGRDQVLTVGPARVVVAMLRALYTDYTTFRAIGSEDMLEPNLITP